MAEHSDNRRRAFAEVVAVDAWHDDFAKERSRVSLHADVTFDTARVGGEQESPVTFRLALKCADVIVITPSTEPVSVDKASVSRDNPDYSGAQTLSSKNTIEGTAGGQIAAEISASGLKATSSAQASASGKRLESRCVELSLQSRLITVTQSITAEGYYKWSLVPNFEDRLKGKPWDAYKAPRLQLIDKRKDRTRGVAPAVRVEVWCRREDLVIEDIKLKDKKLWNKLCDQAGFRNRLAAAESYIREKLLEEGLEVGEIRDKFSRLTLASTMAGPT